MLRSGAALLRQEGQIRSLLSLTSLTQVPTAPHQPNHYSNTNQFHLLQFGTASLSTSSTQQSPDAAPSTSGYDDAPAWAHRGRLQEYYETVVARELMLKTNARHFMALPKLKRVDLTVQALDIHSRVFTEKWQMLVHGLGLEFLTGLKAYYSQQHGKQFRGGNVSAARVTLRGGQMYDFLEKLTLLALPNQVGFMGFPESAIDSEGNFTFKLGNLLNFPDFEEHFDTFEELRSIHVNMVFQNTTREHTRLLLSALHFPFEKKEQA